LISSPKTKLRYSLTAGPYKADAGADAVLSDQHAP